MPATPLGGVTLAPINDPAFRDNYAQQIYDAIDEAQNETLTKTQNQNFADKDLSRPVLKDYAETVYAHGNVTGAVTVDITNGNHQTMTLTGNVTLTISNPSPTGKRCFLALDIAQDGTGGRTVTFPAACENAAGSNFAISGTVANGVTEVFLRTDNAGTLWRCKQGETWL